MDGLPFRHQNMSLSTEYDYQQAIAQHAAAVNAANSSSLHSAMAQIPTLPAALNLTMNSVNQGYSSPGLSSSMGNSNAAYQYSYGSLGSSGGGGTGNSVGQHHGGHGGHHAGGGKSKKKYKLNKDGVPPPKRATTAYIHFTQWYREELKRSGREIPKIGEFGKECAGKWNAMNEEQREPFLDSAARDKERYKREMSIYKPERDANKPKRPGTAFMIFMADFRKEMAGKEPEGGVAAMAKLGGERWRGMTDEDKHPYVEKQLDAKLRYEHSMEEYRKTQNIEAQAQAAAKARAAAEEENRSSPSDNSFGMCQQGNSQQQQQHMVRSQPTPPSGCSTPASTASSPAAQDLSSSPSGMNTPASSVASTSGGNTGPLPSFSTSLALSHPGLTNPHATSLAMSYAQYSLPSFAHAGVLAANYTQAHSHSSTSAAHLPTSSSTYSQAHMQDPYRWS